MKRASSRPAWLPEATPLQDNRPSPARVPMRLTLGAAALIVLIFGLPVLALNRVETPTAIQTAGHWDAARQRLRLVGEIGLLSARLAPGIEAELLPATGRFLSVRPLDVRIRAIETVGGEVHLAVEALGGAALPATSIGMDMRVPSGRATLWEQIRVPLAARIRG